MKLSKKTIGLIFAIPGTIIVLGYLFFYIIRFSGSDNEVVCSDFRIEFNDATNVQLINAAEINVLVENAGLYPVGKKFRKVNTDKIEGLLRKNPMIRAVESYKTPAGVVVVKVVQRVPKFLVAGVENYYVDNDKKFFPTTLNHAVYVPVVSGRVTQSYAVGELFDFISFIEKNAFWNAQIEQIYVRDDLKIELVPRVGDAIIVLGRLDGFEKKLSNLEKLYKHGFSKLGWDKYSVINLQYDGQVVCKRNPEYHVQAMNRKKESAIMQNDSIEDREL